MPDGLTYFDGVDPSDDDEDEDDEDDDQPPQAIPLGSKRRAALMAVGLITERPMHHMRAGNAWKFAVSHAGDAALYFHAMSGSNT